MLAQVLNSQCFTCLLSFLLLIIILLSRELVGDKIQLYFLIIVVLLIIVVCLMDNLTNSQVPSPSFKENFNSETPKIDADRRCYNRSKEYKKYNHKIDKRLDEWRDIEEKDRVNVDYGDEIFKLGDMAEMNQDYLANGESF